MERCDAKELKKILRKEIRAKIESLDPEYCIQADRDIFKQVTELEAYKQGKAIFCFVGTWANKWLCQNAGPKASWMHA